MMSGIKDYHMSTLGKRFHRQLGRLLSLRVGLFRGSNLADAREALNYYMPIVQQAKLELLIDDIAGGGKFEC